MREPEGAGRHPARIDQPRMGPFADRPDAGAGQRMVDHRLIEAADQPLIRAEDQDA